MAYEYTPPKEDKWKSAKNVLDEQVVSGGGIHDSRFTIFTISGFNLHSRLLPRSRGLAFKIQDSRFSPRLAVRAVRLPACFGTIILGSIPLQFFSIPSEVRLNQARQETLDSSADDPRAALSYRQTGLRMHGDDRSTATSSYRRRATGITRRRTFFCIRSS